MPARIVQAMFELKERRDDGELVHEILLEVAQTHEVAPSELRVRAEASWGAPLETDRQRNVMHFAAVESAADMARQAREFAKMVYEKNLPYVRTERWWRVNWPREIENALSEIGLGDPVLEQIARREFLDASTHYETILDHVRKAHA